MGKTAVAKRRDPVFRSTDGARSAGIQNANPERHYVLVHKNSEQQGPDYYEDIGYNYVDPTTDPERLRGIKNRSESGSTLEGRGHVLMWISKEAHAELKRYGAFGDTGEAMADELQDAILDRDAVVDDTFRGKQGRMKLRHGVSAPTPFENGI